MFSDCKRSWNECQSCLDLQRTSFKSAPDNFNLHCWNGFKVVSASHTEDVFRCLAEGDFSCDADWAEISTGCVCALTCKRAQRCLSLRGCLRTKTISLMGNWHSPWERGTRGDVPLVSLLRNCGSSAQSAALLYLPADAARPSSYCMWCVLELLKS